MDKISYLGSSLLAVAIVLGGCDDERRNGYMLAEDAGEDFGHDYNPLHENGYDWWWHSFVAQNRATGELQPFFIEYYVINPGLGGDEPVLGQLPENQELGIRPSYAMIKAGTWAQDASVEINNFYGITELEAATEYMDVRIGSNIATETELVGAVSMSQEDAQDHPEFMSDAGEMSWDLDVEKPLSYSVGYAASELFTQLDAFQMYWHVHGMQSEYAGTVTYNGQVYDVIPEQSYGYQDKNWGNDYTNPWVWLNCNNFVSEDTGEPLELTSLAVGGGNPQAFGISLGEKVLIALYYKGELLEWNFTEELQKQQFEVIDEGDQFRWKVDAVDGDHAIVIDFTHDKDKMQFLDYENPRGEKQHDMLWNGGYAEGTVELYERRWFFFWKKVDTLHGSFGGAEIGTH